MAWSFVQYNREAVITASCVSFCTHTKDFDVYVSFRQKIYFTAMVLFFDRNCYILLYQR